jgi:predicted nucleic acid-binding protein
MREKLFFDSDVILDIATNREPFSVPAAVLLSKIEQKEYGGYTSSTVITNVYYVQRKLESHSKSIQFIKKLRLILKILAVDDEIIQKALESSFKDFEDGIQYQTALKHRVDFFITRNIEDYKKSRIAYYTPEEFLSFTSIRNRADFV